MPPQFKPPSIKRIVDSMLLMPHFRVDEQLGVFARQLVTETIRELFVVDHEDAKWATGELFPIDPSLSEGASEYSFNEIEHVGRAKIVADNATDLPRADIKGKQRVMPIKSIGISLEFSDQEVRTAGLQGLFDIPTEKATAAREGHDFELNDLIRVGDAAAGLYGATNHPGIIVMQAATGQWLSVATPEQIVQDFNLAVNTMVEQSRGVERPDTAVFPTGVLTFLSTTPLDPTNGSNITILEFLRKAHPGITTWTDDPGMDSVAADGGPALQIYRKDKTRGRAVVPMTLVAKPPERKGLVTVINFESRFGGVMYPKPRSNLRLEGIV